ncbi:MAG: J domain-containing protein [Spirochaetaceae bacterium]|nr:J domain-containing protein [Spirochaetaceae bacterium]
MPRMQAARTALDDLISEIGRQEQAGGPWRLTPAQLQDILGLTPDRYYQEIYGAQMAGHPLIELSLALEPFSQSSAPALVAVLEHLCGAGAESALQRAGVFLSHDEQAEIMAEFLAGAANEVRRHEFQADEFAAMLRTFGRFPEARRVYLDHFFDLDDLQQRAARRYCAGRTFTLPDLALANARSVLRLFFDRHVLRRRSIFGSLHEAFRRVAAEAGFADDSGAHRRQRARREEPDGPRGAVDQAHRAMGLGPGPLTARSLKARYKELMKRFHPDVNPRGLKRCQEINAAYATLSELVVAG